MTGSGRNGASPSRASVIAIVNQKGGVGKSTTAVNLGASMAELGKRVLIIDLDPQGNATSGLGFGHVAREECVYQALVHDRLLKELVLSTAVDGLSLVPATIQLAGAEIELVPAFSRELRLRRALEPIIALFDFILIDCPPSLGLLTVNALAGADHVLIPVQCEYYALEGLAKLLESISLVRDHLNPELDVAGVLMTMHDARTKLSHQVIAEVREHFAGPVYATVIPRTVRLSEAPSHGKPISTYDRASRGTKAYFELAREVVGHA